MKRFFAHGYASQKTVVCKTGNINIIEEDNRDSKIGSITESKRVFSKG